MQPITNDSISKIIPSQSVEKVTPEQQIDQRTFAMRMNDFGFEMYKKAAKSQDGNVLLSSPSAFFALSMAYLGAKGNTLEEMKNALEMPDSMEEVMKSIKILRENLSDGKILNIANNVFVNDWTKLNKEYEDELFDVFGTTPESVKFSDRQEATETINNWVKEKTNNKISEIVSPDMIDSNTAAILVNAIYLLANWENQFQKTNTINADFHLTSNTSVEVPMMSQSTNYRYYSNENFSMVEMPYEESDPKTRSLSMLVILPNEGKSIDDIESELSSETLSNWLDNTTNRKVSLHMPRFEIESTNSLSKVLKELGMHDAFSGQADFSGISKNNPIAISDVIQKTYIKVDETGTEAAAVTGIFMRGTSVGPRPVTFKANRPFLLMIIDKASQAVLFTGRVTNPKN